MLLMFLLLMNLRSVMFFLLVDLWLLMFCLLMGFLALMFLLLIGLCLSLKGSLIGPTYFHINRATDRIAELANKNGMYCRTQNIAGIDVL